MLDEQFKIIRSTSAVLKNACYYVHWRGRPQGIRTSYLLRYRIEVEEREHDDANADGAINRSRITQQPLRCDGRCDQRHADEIHHTCDN